MSMKYFLRPDECHWWVRELQLFAGRGTDPQRWPWEDYFELYSSCDQFPTSVLFKATDTMKELIDGHTF